MFEEPNLLAVPNAKSTSVRQVMSFLFVSAVNQNH